MESLIKTGHVTRGYMGVMIQKVTPALAQGLSQRASRRAGQ